MKKLLKCCRLVSGLLLILNFLLGACASPATTPTPLGQSATPTATAKPSPTASITLRWSYWGSDAEVEINKKIAETFEKTNPDIKIVHVFKPYEEYFDAIKGEWKDNVPDVLFLNNIPAYAADGLIENLEPLIERDKFNLQDFYESLLLNFHFNGALYGLPRDSDTKVIYYNRKMFDEAGIPYPKTGWKWEDLRQTALKLTKTNPDGTIARYGYAFELVRWWRLWVWQNDGELYSPFTPPQPPAELLLNSPQAAEAIQFFADLINKDKVSPPYDDVASSAKIQKLFVEGKTAMAFGGPGAVLTYSKVPNLSWDIVGLPYSKKRVNVGSGAGYTIAKSSRQKEAAWRFLKFLEGDFGQTLYADSGLIVPARRSVRTDNIISRKQSYSTDTFKGEIEIGRPNLAFTTVIEVDKIIERELLAVWQGKARAQAVLASLLPQVAPYLKTK